MHHMNIHVKHGYLRDGFAVSQHMGHNGPMNIASIRKQRGLTQIDLAGMTKLTQPTISRAERGDDSTTMATIVSIAAALQVPVADLFSSDRTAAEMELLQHFRRLPPERQKGWLDMARLVDQDQP